MRFFCLLLGLFSFLPIKAQVSPKPSYTLTPRLHYGFIWNFAEEVAHLSNQHMPALELNLTKQTHGNKEWQREYNYPQVGYSLMYFAFDKQKPVGNALLLFAHAGKNFYKTRRTSFQWRMGFGLAYVKRGYDEEFNLRNNAISQKINFTINGQLNYNIRLTQHVLFNVGAGLVHISNGSLKLPNFGLNLPTVHAGVGIELSKGEELLKKDSVRLFNRKTYFHISPFAGIKEVYPVNGPKYFLGGLSVLIERRMNRKSGLHAGLEFSYDHSKKSEIVYNSLELKNIFINRTQAGVLVGHELYINRLSLLTQMGVYLYDPTHLNKSYYQKVGFKYYVSEKVFVNMSMKLHLGIADWIEWGGGIRL